MPVAPFIDRAPHFQKLEELAGAAVSIETLFKTEPKRLETFVMREGPLRADFSKQQISSNARGALLSLAAACQLDEWRAKLFAGDKVNTSEDRAVLHMALRGVGGTKAVQKQVKDMRKLMAAFADKIRSDGKFKNIVHIGIGGSDLGPRLVADAFEAAAEQSLTLRFAENVDGASVNDAIKGLNPKETLAIVVSKSFGTQETKMNGESVRAWLAESLGKKAGDHMLAVTANREGAQEFGVPADQIFDFWDWVGGRYSVWSAVGLSLQIAYGPDVFDEFLKGAKKMDEHFRDQPLDDNLPVMLAMTGIWNRHALGFTSPGAPVDFVAVLKDHENRPEHHRTLLANCFAQSEALMLGKAEHVVRAEMGENKNIDAIAPQKTFPGNRPSTTITLDELSPFALGHLIALYEHKVFVQGVIWNVNSFDHW